MAQLITMRQRIKAVESIKKITHAMRLIAMSTHSRLRHKKENLEQFRQAFESLGALVRQQTKDGPKSAGEQKRELVILVSSQKGLCGNFNGHLFSFFQSSYAPGTAEIITVGKYAADFCKTINITPLMQFDLFSSALFVKIAQEITGIIFNDLRPFSNVTVYSNFPKTFFLQKPQRFILLPIKEKKVTRSTTDLNDYILEESPESLSAHIQKLTTTVVLEELLFESLLAEQAARFLSMDASTRNAENLLNDMKLEYNKTRQATITRELTELATSF